MEDHSKRGGWRARTMAFFGRLLAVFLSVVVMRPAVIVPRIEVLEGDGAVNNIGVHRAKEPVVRVVDQDGHPIPNVAVTFLLPSQGPGGVFANGQNSITVMSDADGKAVGHGLRPNGAAGQFQIRVTTSLAGQVATATVTQVNAGAGKSGGSTKTLLILALIGGAGAVGAALALKGKSSSSGSMITSTGVVITPGSPTVGAP